MIQDLNVAGEVITLIDPNADVIQDPAVQKILKSLDGERTVVLHSNIIFFFSSKFENLEN